MARLTHATTGVTVDVADALVERLGREWKPEGAVPEGAPSEAWKLADLHAYAQEHDVDLNGATKKADIVAAITAASEAE